MKIIFQDFFLFLPHLGDDVLELEPMLETEGVKEDDNDDINILEELEDSSQRHSSVGEKLTTITSSYIKQ